MQWFMLLKAKVLKTSSVNPSLALHEEYTRNNNINSSKVGFIQRCQKQKQHEGLEGVIDYLCL